MPRVVDQELEFVFNLTAYVRKLPREDREMLMEDFMEAVGDTLREELKLDAPMRRRRASARAEAP